MPGWGSISLRKACLISRTSLAVSASSITCGWASRPVKIRCIKDGLRCKRSRTCSKSTSFNLRALLISSRMRRSQCPAAIFSVARPMASWALARCSLEGVRVPLDAAEPLAGGDQLNVAVHLPDAIPLPGVEVPLHELDDADPHGMTAGTYCHSQSRGGLPLAISGDDQNQPLAFFRFQSLNCLRLAASRRYHCRSFVSNQLRTSFPFPL